MPGSCCHGQNPVHDLAAEEQHVALLRQAIGLETRLHFELTTLELAWIGEQKHHGKATVCAYASCSIVLMKVVMASIRPLIGGKL